MPRQPIILAEWIPVETELGKGYAFMIETENHDNWYTCILDNQCIVTVQQEKLVVQRSYSHQRSLAAAELKTLMNRFVEKLHGPDTRGQGKGDGQEGPRLVKS